MADTKTKPANAGTASAARKAAKQTAKKAPFKKTAPAKKAPAKKAAPSKAAPAKKAPVTVPKLKGTPHNLEDLFDAGLNRKQRIAYGASLPKCPICHAAKGEPCAQSGGKVIGPHNSRFPKGKAA